MTTTKESIKQNFLDDLSPGGRQQIQPLHNAVIDEAIENILNGKCKINDRLPDSRDDYFIAIAYSLVAGQAAFSGLFDMPERPSQKGLHIDLVFRDQKYNYFTEASFN